MLFRSHLPFTSCPALGGASTCFCFRVRRKKLVDGRPSPTMTKKRKARRRSRSPHCPQVFNNSKRLACLVANARAESSHRLSGEGCASQPSPESDTEPGKEVRMSKVSYVASGSLCSRVFVESAGASQRGDRDASPSGYPQSTPRRGTRQGSDIDDIGS